MTVTINLPDALYDKAQTILEQQHTSIDILVQEYLVKILDDHWSSLSRSVTAEDFQRILDSAPDVEPEEYDRI